MLAPPPLLEGGAAPARQHSRRTTPPGLGRELRRHPAAGAEPWSQQDQSSLSHCRPAPPGASGAVTQLGSLENLTIFGRRPDNPGLGVGELDYLGGDPTSSWSCS